MNTIGKKAFAALAGLMIMMGAECSEEKEFTCEQIKGWGYHEVTVYKCEGSEVEILNGKLYVKKKGNCTKTRKVYRGKYAYSRYTGKSGRSFNVDAGDLIKIAGAAAGIPAALPD